ncbi:MAG: hypothetical protein WBP58_09290 [Chitinophagaceae bacterium]
MQKLLVLSAVFVCLTLIGSAQDVRGNEYQNEVNRLRKAATRQIELSEDTCEQFADSTRLNLWFVLARMEGNKTEIKVIAESTKAPVSFSIYPHKPLDVNWAIIASKNQPAFLVIPASIGCLESNPAESESFPLVPPYLPDHFAGFWNSQIHVVQPIWCQLSSRRY